MDKHHMTNSLFSPRNSNKNKINIGYKYQPRLIYRTDTSMLKFTIAAPQHQKELFQNLNTYILINWRHFKNTINYLVLGF